MVNSSLLGESGTLLKVYWKDDILLYKTDPYVSFPDADAER